SSRPPIAPLHLLITLHSAPRLVETDGRREGPEGTQSRDNRKTAFSHYFHIHFYIEKEKKNAIKRL
ncbi:MAG: hypothetical protein QXU62_08265, partial [Thermofilaceae archaeon]